MNYTLRVRHISCHFVHVAHKYDNFIVGLTNSTPTVSAPTPWNYEVCGRYPGAVPNGKTVSVLCRDCLPSFRYVIVQIPNLNYHFVACEVEVLVRGKWMSSKLLSILWYLQLKQKRCYMYFLLYAGEHLPIVLHDVLDYCLTWPSIIKSIMMFSR